MKKKKKIKRLIIILLLILTVIILISVFTKNKENINYKEKLVYINSEQWNDEKYPTGMPVLVQLYEGELSAQNIGKSFYYVANEYFPKINLKLQDSNEKDIRKYYNSNKREILMMLGGVNEDEFVLLVNEIIKIKNKNIKFEKYYLDIESIVSEKNSTTGDLYIKYENSDEIKIKISVIGYFKDEVSSVKYYK